MDDGGKTSAGIKLCTNAFTYSDVEKLAFILTIKYSLKTSIHKTGKPNQYVIYIHKQSLQLLFDIVKPYLHETMYYKFANLNPQYKKKSIVN